ncbi:MAG: acyl carrier protein [bacterium]|nr:acyl carrier protein [bacterium]
MEREKIRTFIHGHLVVFEDEAEYSDSDNIFELGFVNSLFAIQLVNYVQNEFEIEIDDDDIDIANFSSVDNIIKLIQRKREGQ